MEKMELPVVVGTRSSVNVRECQPARMQLVKTFYYTRPESSTRSSSSYNSNVGNVRSGSTVRGTSTRSSSSGSSGTVRSTSTRSSSTSIIVVVRLLRAATLMIITVLLAHGLIVLLPLVLL